jgi:hypothetical protein
MKIPLTRGKCAIIDDIDADLAEFKWYATKSSRTFYANRRIRTPRGRTTVALHQVIAQRIGITGLADHTDRDGLNCRRSNLRAATAKENIYNRARPHNNTSGFIGVTKDHNNWRSQIRHSGQLEYIGYYPLTEAGKIEAARAYNKRALELRGEWAVLNQV